MAAAPININCRDDVQVAMPRDLLRRFSPFVVTQNSDTITVDVPDQHMIWLKEYIEHHEKKHGSLPAGTVDLKWTLESAFEPTKDNKDVDRWDAEFLKRVIASEQDPYLKQFSETALLFEVTLLVKKIALAIAIYHVGKAGSMDADRLAEEFAKMAAK